MHDENLYEGTLFSDKAKWPQLGVSPFFKVKPCKLTLAWQVSGQWYIEPVSVLPTEKLQQLQHSRRMALQAEAKW